MSCITIMGLCVLLLSVTSNCNCKCILILQRILNQRIHNLNNFPTTTPYASSYRSRSVAMQRARLVVRPTISGLYCKNQLLSQLLEYCDILQKNDGCNMYICSHRMT